MVFPKRHGDLFQAEKVAGINVSCVERSQGSIFEISFADHPRQMLEFGKHRILLQPCIFIAQNTFQAVSPALTAPGK